jgi:N-acetylglucosamine kinase-like BadF-type ATPase
LGIHGYLLALEGGGTRSQAALFNSDGNLLGMFESSDVNTNFVPFDLARRAIFSAVRGALTAAGVNANEVGHFASSLVAAGFRAETFLELCPKAQICFYGEKDVIFARAGFYRPHGVAVVAATGATVWGIRQDNGRQAAFGGWGSLLGDEGSAYALGLLGLRNAARAYEGRCADTTRMVEALCEHFHLNYETFHEELVRLAYHPPLNRAEIAGVAKVVTKLAGEGDALALRIAQKVAADLAALAIHAMHSLFQSAEQFDVVVAGGLINAGDLILAPLKAALGDEFPLARFHIGDEQPAVALGKLAFFDLYEKA